MNVKVGSKRTMSSMSPGNKMAVLLDDRNDLCSTINEARGNLRTVETRLKIMIMKDPVGLEQCVTINWRKLERMFGS